MCGRFVSARKDYELLPLFDVDERVGEELAPSYNIAPTQTVRIVLEDAADDGPVRRMRNVRWGLLPVWAKDRKMASRLINARSETVTEKPSFRSAATKRRCVVPADGYYEWQKTESGRKIPYYLHGPEEEVLPLVGLYERWPDPDVPEEDPAHWVWTCTVLTRPATDSLGFIHDRAPVILPMDMVGDWLDPAATGKARVNEMIDAVPDPELVPRKVTTAVGSPRNNTPGLLYEVA
ncbi:SOS response-associated peptidase [Nocardiopsis composta]|uniref:Abasic site processing protein n=1 Tax=Nocardiopsis composta TaxID=157465 RepID=A0A7W8QH42_9ACTN|nr:SOS response-associated peptidase [Nocardiopsis composta]MBB5430348.1 putative SOS response-associated peptidase YedK [Nocardiopsis composta]